MRLSILVRALREYAESADISRAEHQDVLYALQDAVRLEDIAGYFNQGDMDVEIVSYEDLISLSNIALYDGIGEIMRKNHSLPNDLFVYDRLLKDKYGIMYLTYLQLKNIVSFLQDLWKDNEEGGYNDEAGHFKE